MAKREYIQRHLLIVKRLKSNPSSFSDLLNYLLAQEDITGDNFDISKRTFQRDLKEIYSIYGIEIKFNKSEGVYYIHDEQEEKPFERIIEAFETLNALNYTSNITNLILEKRLKLGTEHMTGLLYAIEKNVAVTFTHQGFYKSEESKRNVQPIAIKEAQNRWYLIAFDLDKKEPRNFGLDRIQNLEITAKKCSKPSINPTAYYQHAFGIETYETAQKVIISCDTIQAKFLKSLPLHHSQKIVKETSTTCYFEYFVHPTHDFIMEIMKFGQLLKVEEPTFLQEKIIEKIEAMVVLYK